MIDRLEFGKKMFRFVAYGALGFFGGSYFGHEQIPNIEEVQAGYIAPNKLEIECKDLDENGELETVVKIGGIPFLLKYNQEGKPILPVYEDKK